MTTFAPDYTTRVVYKYLSAGFQHSWTFRVPLGTGVTAAFLSVGGVVEDLTAASQSLMPTDFAITDIIVIPENDSVGISFGPDIGQPTGAQDIADYTPLMRGTGTTFKGSGQGSPAHICFFGMFWDPSDVAGPAANGRVEAAENAVVSAMISVLRGAGSITTIQGGAISWKGYATVKENDYWVKQARKLFS